MSDEFRPVNQDTDPRYNAKPGIAIVPGSRAATEFAKFEQFHTKFTAGTQPGNPYRFREFPQMLYKASKFNGIVACIATVGSREKYEDPRELEFKQEQAEKFTRENQRIVKNEQELQKALEAGYRHSPQEAIDWVMHRDDEIAKQTAHREYEDRNMSEPAKREIAAVKAEADENVPEVKAKPVRRRGRPKGSRNKKRE